MEIARKNGMVVTESRKIIGDRLEEMDQDSPDTVKYKGWKKEEQSSVCVIIIFMNLSELCFFEMVLCFLGGFFTVFIRVFLSLFLVLVKK